MQGIYYSKFNKLTDLSYWGLALRILLGCLSFLQWSYAVDDHLFGNGPSGFNHNRYRPGAGVAPTTDSCRVSAASLADHADGNAFSYAVVEYVTSPGCISSRTTISQRALSYKIRFSRELPLPLESFANAILAGDFEANRRVEETLARSAPEILEQNSIPMKKLLPLTGQLAILSPPAARSALAQLIVEELKIGSDRIDQRSIGETPIIGAEIAKTVQNYGAAEPAIAFVLADRVRNMALYAQADSLAKVFRSLVAAAGESPKLIPTLTLTSEALAQGVKRAKGFYSKPTKKKMLASVFGAVQMTVQVSSDSFDEASQYLNESIGVLAENKNLDDSAMKNLWFSVVTVLASTSSQPKLASMLAKSIIPDVVVLPQKNIELLFSAASHYPILALALQDSFLIAWERLKLSGMERAQVEKVKKQYFLPFAERVYELGPESIDFSWIVATSKEGFITDSIVEKRFPRIMLHSLQAQHRPLKSPISQLPPDMVLGESANQFVSLWKLSRLHVPILMDWVSRNSNH